MPASHAHMQPPQPTEPHVMQVSNCKVEIHTQAAEAPIEHLTWETVTASHLEQCLL